MRMSDWVISRRLGSRRAGSPSAGAADDPCRTGCSWGTAFPPPRSRTRNHHPMYKNRSIERRTRIGAQDILVNRATAQGNGPHRFNGRFDFSVGHGFSLNQKRGFSGGRICDAKAKAPDQPGLQFRSRELSRPEAIPNREPRQELRGRLGGAHYAIHPFHGST